MIAVIDSGGANLTSLMAAIRRLGRQASLVRDEEQLRQASHAILPGVGSAGAAMVRLRGLGLNEVLPRLEIPVLGICLGMQLLFEGSEEGDTECLGSLAGRAQKLAPSDGVTVPHMGWSRVSWRAEHFLARGLSGEEYFYFVHSYAVGATPDTLATTRHGRDFSAIVQKGNFFGTQFHPERSGSAGARLIENFLEAA